MSYRAYDSKFNTRPRFRGFPLFVRIFVIAVFALTLTGIGFSVFGASSVTGTAVGCTVTDKDRSSDGDGGSDMRIYTEGCDGKSAVKVFHVADNWFAGEVASADTYAGIQIGKTYNFETRGMRIPVLSSFENIVGVTVTGK
jgi:hypothetical protein